jgi:hypothetical protein
MRGRTGRYTKVAGHSWVMSLSSRFMVFFVGMLHFDKFVDMFYWGGMGLSGEIASNKF